MTDSTQNLVFCEVVPGHKDPNSQDIATGGDNKARRREAKLLRGNGVGVARVATGRLSSLTLLALVLRYQRKYEAFKKMNGRALVGREKVLEVEHADTLTSVHSLAYLFHHQQ